MCASCSILCKNKLKNTAWSCVEEEFVADDGEIHTLILESLFTGLVCQKQKNIQIFQL